MTKTRIIDRVSAYYLVLTFMFISAYGYSFQHDNYSDFRNKHLKQPICAIDSISLCENIKLLELDSISSQFIDDYVYFKDLAVMYHRIYQFTSQDSDINRSISYFTKSIQTNPKEYSSIWNLKKDCPQGLYKKL